jgi:hypothetical protein
MSDDVEMIERERRQLTMMNEQILRFRSGDLSLGRLIADLEGLLAALTFATDEWIDDFWSAWGDLEIPYAVALDRLTPIPDARDPNVADGLFELDVLIRQAIADLA